MGNSEENRYHFENHSEAAPRQERVEWHHTGDGNDFTPRDRKPAKEKKHIGRKILTVAAVAALCCGSGAGGAFYASRYLVSKYPAVNTSVSSSGDAVVEKLSTTKAQEGGRISTDVTSVASNVMPAIVAINADVTEKVQTFMGTMEQKGTGSGSGIIVGKNEKELLIATNNHVVDNADKLQVVFNDGTKAVANLKGTDAKMDLAVIAVSIADLKQGELSNLKVATLGDSDKLSVGEPTIAIGNALGYGQSVTTGGVSALNREIKSDEVKGTFIQTDAAINPGNSGGALLNSKGEVIGINSSKIGGEAVDGVGFAIPIDAARPILDKLMNQETKIKVADADKGYLGITVMTPQGVEGAYVESVEQNGAAQKAGIQAGDIITALNGQSVSKREDLTNQLSYYKAGTEVTVTVLRRESTTYGQKDLKVTLEKKPQGLQDQTQQSSDNDQNGNQGQNSQGDSEEENGNQNGWNMFPFGGF